MQRNVIIVAGGSGTRMQQSTPKQFIKLLEKPIMVHTIEAFLRFDPYVKIVLVLPEAHLDTWAEINREFLPDLDVVVALGGLSRFQSVKAGLEEVSEGLVAIHDAVRPLIGVKAIERSFKAAGETGSGVVMVPLKDSIRSIDKAATIAEDRSKYMLVQTPQTFRVDLIKKAFMQAEQAAFTDDASVYESAGMAVTVVEGDYRNLKITTPEDLLVAEALLASLS